jgi:hypothetical protein
MRIKIRKIFRRRRKKKKELVIFRNIFIKSNPIHEYISPDRFYFNVKKYRNNTDSKVNVSKVLKN